MINPGKPARRKRAKRVHWWDVPGAICPHCQIGCKCHSTKPLESGGAIQYRTCPNCGYDCQTVIGAATGATGDEIEGSSVT